MTETVAGEAAVPCGEPYPLPGVRAETLEAFQRLYRDHFPRLSGYCASLAGDRELGAEIAQEAFTRLFARWRSAREPRALVYFMATNLAIDHWRRQQRQVAMLSRLVEVPVTSPDRMASELREAIDGLPRPLREVVLLHYYADLPLTDIVAATGRPIGTVKRHLHEARGRLQRFLEEP